MSVIDNFMSQIIDFNEKEKEETILFLANATTCNPDHGFLKFISKKVSDLLINFVSDAVEERNKYMEGGEKVNAKSSLQKMR